ncbi:alpha/beta fold hydrolase [Agromyces badenianii]|uniref:alpha/beta fold hydrolase n=1 Tax=Agromyces badenianii TaxID=2080742 RepID=UPI000D598CB2|nr:alpha/beta fold hydrolase [Agromyces badenianii]PWC05685.1 esterase [Agromyces badenianii]
MLRSTCPPAEAEPRVPVARSLRGALADLARTMPTDIATAVDIAAYRRAGAARGTTAEAVAARLGLTAEGHELEDGSAVTVFRGERVAARVVFLHGGGLIAGNRFDGVDVVARHADALDLEVWTVEYPLAPEHRLERMVETVIEAVVACADDGLPVVLAGQSGGGGLAAATAMECRDRGIPLVGQLLICPMLGREPTPAIRQFAQDPSWSELSNATAWAAVLAGSELVPPAERDDLAGLAPSFLDTGSAELFRDTIVGYAGGLWAHGCRAELHVWSGAFHGSDCAAESPVVSIEAHRARREWLRRMLTDEL